MAIKKSQIEDKSLKPDNESQDESSKIREKKKIEFNYPEHGITIKAASKEEADEKLKKLKK